MPAQKDQPNTGNGIIYTDQQNQQHVEQIAQHLSQAVNAPVDPYQVIPTLEQHPLDPATREGLPDPEKDHLEEEGQPKVKDSDLHDIMQGLQGKPRSAPAQNFLKAKMAWVARRYKDAKVGLK